MLPQEQRLKKCTITILHDSKVSDAPFPRMHLVNHCRGDCWPQSLDPSGSKPNRVMSD